MPIDYSDYIDLSLFNSSPPDIYLAALEYARLTIPELTIRQGTPEDAILQAASYIASENLSAINALPNRLMSGVLSLLGVPRDEGDFPLVDVEFTAATHEGAVIEAGTLVRYEYALIDPPFAVYFETVAELLIEAVENTGSTPLPTGTIEAKGNELLEIFPIAENSPVQIESVNADVYTAKITEVTSIGRLPESDTEYLNRSTTYLGSLSSAFGKASQIEAFILSAFFDARRVKVYDLTDPTGALEISEATAPGKITIFTYGSGANLSSEKNYEILVAVSNRSIAGLQIGVRPAVVAEISAEISVIYSSGFTPAIIGENIQRALLTTINPNSYPFTDLIRKSSIIPIILSVPGVQYVQDLTLDWEETDVEYTVDTDGNLEIPYKGVLPNIQETNIVVNLILGT
jgi:hypothetical protein